MRNSEDILQSCQIKRLVVFLVVLYLSTVAYISVYPVCLYAVYASIDAFTYDPLQRILDIEHTGGFYLVRKHSGSISSLFSLG